MAGHLEEVLPETSRADHLEESYGFGSRVPERMWNSAWLEDEFSGASDEDAVPDLCGELASQGDDHNTEPSIPPQILS